VTEEEVTAGFATQFAELQRDLEQARSELTAAVSALDDAALARARPGGWTVGKVLDHVVQAEWHYARLIGLLRGATPEEPRAAGIAGSVDAAGALEAARAALLRALAGVSASEFYRLAAIGREEYSVLSVLENVAHHDREHLAQVRRILEGTG